MWFVDLRQTHMPVLRQLLTVSVDSRGAGGTPNECPPPPDLLSLFDRDRPGLSPKVLSAGSVIYGQRLICCLWEMSP